MNCAGAPNLIKKAPPQESSIYAAQGTAAHEVLEYCFDSNASPYDYEGEEMSNGVIMKQEDIEAVVEAITFLEKELEDGEYTIYKEMQVDLSMIHKDLWSTLDITLINEDLTKLKVFDYKHGSGTKVEIYENKQLLYYGLGAIAGVAMMHGINYMDTMGWGHVFKEVTIGIIQPRCFHKDGPLRKWIVPPERLDSFAAELKVKAMETEKKDAPLTAGAHCKWCPAVSICGGFRRKTEEVLLTDFDVIKEFNPPSPNELTTEQIIKVLKFQETISDWLKQVNGYAFHKLEKGNKISGYKLVRKRANRKWGDAAEAHNFFVDMRLENFHERKMMSPAKIEKLFKDNDLDKSEIQHLIIKPEAGLTLAPEHDKREAVIVDPAEAFEVIE